MNSSNKKAIQHIETYALTRQEKAKAIIIHILKMSDVADEFYTKAIQQINDNACVAVHFHPDRLNDELKSVAASLYETGFYQNQFETKLSNGMLAPYKGSPRDQWEITLFGGAYDEATFFERPKYGALDLMNHADGPAPRFGSCYFLLEAKVTKDCTFTYMDSHENPPEKGTLNVFEDIMVALLRECFERQYALGQKNITPPQLLEKLTYLDIVSPDKYQQKPNSNLDHYIEAQIHRTISLENDVKTLVIDPSFKETETGILLQKIGEKYDIEIQYHNGFELEIADVPTDFRGAKMPILAEKIALNKVINPHIIGKAAADLKKQPETWNESGTYKENLQSLKLLWHVLLKYGALCLLFIACPILAQDVVLNEILAQNATTLADATGDYEDWIELQNNTGNPIDLKDYWLTDNIENNEKWYISEALLLGANEQLLIWCDDDEIEGALHANFKLNADGECLYFGIGETVIDQVCFAGQKRDVSYGRIADGSEWKYFENPSPSMENANTGKDGFTPAPVPSHKQGYYQDAFSLEINQPFNENTIYYTTDGSIPDTSNLVYTTPLLIDSNTVLRYFASQENFIKSDVISQTFIKDKTTDLPSVFIVMNPAHLFSENTGIYTDGNFLYLWERPTNVSLLKQEKETLFQLDGGIKISGASTRYLPQKSFNINTKSKYGEKNIKYPIFENSAIDKYDGMRLRVSGNDNESTLFRDALMQKIVENTHIDIQNYRPTIVYLNAEYWGIYNIREKHGAQYIESKHGVEPVDLIAQNGKASIGDTLFLHETKQFFKENQYRFNEAEIYDSALQIIDIENFIDYYIAQIYFANSDWLDNNTKLWRPENGKWRWLLFDTDLGFGFAPRWGHPGGVDHNTLAWAMNCCDAPEKHNSPKSTLYFRSFLENESFRQAFIQRFNYHLNHTFCVDRVEALIDELVANIENEMPYHLARWNQISSMETWQENVQELQGFAQQRPDYLRQYLQEYFDLKEAKELPIFTNPPNAGTVNVEWDYPFEHRSCSDELFTPSLVNLSVIPNENFEFLAWSKNREAHSKIEFLWDGNEGITAFFTSATSFNLFPNPTTGTLHVQWSDAYNMLKIYDSIGKVVYEKRLNEATYQYEKILLNDLPKGLYILELNSSKENQKQAFILK